jgi:flagellar capping protein FliD
MPTTIDGLVTGLDTTKIIEGLTTVFRRRIELFQSQKERIVDQQTAFKSVEARLLTLQAAVSRLARTQNSVFDTKSVKSSNEDLVIGAASSSALAGTHSFRINNLATAHQIASQGYDGANSLITQGTMQIRVGSGATTTITIDSTNNTLQGLVDAINNASADVTATILNDGTGSLTDHRLLLTAKRTGASNAIVITNNLASDSAGAARPRFNESAVEPVVYGSGWTGTSLVTSGGTYTGPDDDTYTFTVAAGGDVGGTSLQVSYTDGSGTNTGQFTIATGEVDTYLNVAEGLQVKFSAGTLVAGQTFSVNVKRAALPVQAAANASITLGSGAGALTIQSETNNVNNLISGVTINLLGADPATPVQLTIENDTEQAKEAVLGFVESYNELMNFIDEQVRFDPETEAAGTLLGDRSASLIQDDVRITATGVVAGVNGLMNRLSALGISTNAEGRLDVNQSKLDDALAGRTNGVSINDVRRLFALTGQSTHGNVQFVTGSIRTRESTAAYQVDVTQAAERAMITASNALASSIVIDGTNNELTIVVDGKLSGTITLASGTYTPPALAQELQAQINANSAFSGQRVSVSVDNNLLVITSDSFGLASEVRLGAGTALTTLGFAGTESDKGQDVVGNFIVNGAVETAIGTGQFLIGSSTNANTADLQVRVTFTPSQVVEGPEASVTVTRGMASKLDVVLNRMLDPVTGRTKTINDGFQDKVDDLNETIKQQNEMLQAKQESLLRQFIAMESLVSQLKSTGDFLTAQLAAFTNFGANNRTRK